MGIKLVKSSEYKDDEYKSLPSLDWQTDLDTAYSDLRTVAEGSFSTKKMFLKCLDDALKISLIEFCNANIKDSDKQMSTEEISNIANSNFQAEKLRREFHSYIEPERSEGNGERGAFDE